MALLYASDNQTEDAYELRVVVRQFGDGVIPSAENSFAVRVKCDECDELIGPRQKKLDHVDHFLFRFRSLAHVLIGARVFVGIG